MKERTTLSLKLIFSHILLLPIMLAVGELIPSITVYNFLLVQTLLIITYFTGYWEFFGVRLRLSYFLFMEFVLFLLVIDRSHFPLNTSAGWVAFYIFIMAELFLILLLVKIFMVMFKREMDSIEIKFPLKNGRFLITDGGNSKLSRLMNYHYHSRIHKKKGTNQSMKFATDIVRIDPPLTSFLPTHNNDYPIFENKVYSPIDGIVFKVINEIEDNIPYSGNYPYNTGNTIVIKNGDLFLLIGHLRKGSINKKEGERIDSGDLVAEVGNSGYTERPHIHMQLIRSRTDDYWFGIGVSMTFQLINLYKNRIISIRYIA